MGRTEAELAASYLAENRAHLTADDWTIVAPTMSGMSVERREFLEGPKVVVERAIMLAHRIPVDYWVTLKPLKRKIRTPQGLSAIWTPREVCHGYVMQGHPWEELERGVYINAEGQPREGNALTLSLEKVVQHGAKRIRILGVDDTVPHDLRATLNAIRLEGRRQGIDIEMPRADILIAVRRGAF